MPFPLTLADHREIAHNLSSVLSAGSSVLVVGSEFECLEKALKEHSLIVAYFNHGDGLVPSFSAQRLSSRFDAILFNKALPNLSDNELQELIGLSLAALRPNGYILIREDLKDGSHNLSYYTGIMDLYRAPSDLITISSPDNKAIGCDFLWAKCMQATISSKSRWDDICWLVQRKEYDVSSTDGASASTIRAFLDAKQYTDDGIYAYEWIFGDGFISPGGAAQNRKFLEQMDLRPDQQVLDVGCGIGGSLVMMAEEFGANVLGIDLSSNMVSYALEKANGKRNSQINYMVANALRCSFAPSSFDVIYSRDCIIHIQDKVGLFSLFHKWLKPGGKVVMTDYCVGDIELSDQFKTYMTKRQYNLNTIGRYVEAFKAAGFEDVEGIDLSQDFLNILKTELSNAEQNESQFVKKFSQEEFDSLVSGWKSKIGHNKAGEHKWAQFIARKSI